MVPNRKTRRNRPFFITLFALAALSFSPDAAAATDRSDDIRAIVGDFLSNYQTQLDSTASRLVMDGEILVEKSDHYYAVTLPHIKIEDRDGSMLDIGMIAINAMPARTDGDWNMTIAMPTPIITYDENGDPAVTVRIGAQSFAGIYSPRLDNFYKFNAQYDQINVINHTNDLTIDLGRVTMVSDLTANNDDLWSGPTTLTVDNLHAYSDSQPGEIRANRISGQIDIGDYDHKAMAAYEENLMALEESVRSGDNPAASARHQAGTYNLFSDFWTQAFNDLSVRLAVKSLFSDSGERDDHPATTFSLEQGHIHLGLSGLRQNLAGIHTGLAFQGFSSDAVKETAIQDIEPQRFSLNISLNDIPLHDLVATGRETFKNTAHIAESPQLPMIQMAMTMPQMLSAAGSHMAIRDSYMRNDLYDIGLDAKVTANVEAALGAVGESRLTIAGMDRLLAALKTAGQSDALPEGKAAQLQQAATILTILQMVGQNETNDSGDAVRVYNVELNKQGQTLLNGTDMQALMQMTTP